MDGEGGGGMALDPKFTICFHWAGNHVHLFNGNNIYQKSGLCRDNIPHGLYPYQGYYSSKVRDTKSMHISVNGDRKMNSFLRECNHKSYPGGDEFGY